MSRNCRSLLLVPMLSMFVLRATAQSPPKPPSVAAPEKFDVASIRPSGQPGWMGIRVTDDMFEARGVPLNFLVWYAFAGGGLQPKVVSEGTGWMESQNWDIVAKFDDPSLAGLSNEERDDRMRPMVRTLLTERFHLRIHTELRPTSVYLLTQAKGGAKVKEVPAPPEIQGDSTEAMKRFQEENPGKPFPGAMFCGGDRCTATAMTIQAAIEQIQGSSNADRMIIDQTGLKGYYDFSFRNPGKAADDSMLQVEQDLGVRFEPRKIDMTTYVIDCAERPSAN